MKRPRRNRPVVIALYLNAALLGAVLWALLGRSGGLPSFAPSAFGSPLQPPPIAGGGSLYLMPAQFSHDVWGCFIMDIDTQTLCAYEYFSGEKLLRLVAARNFHWDRRLDNYNTLPLQPDVKKWVDLAHLHANEDPSTLPSSDTPANK